MTDILNRIVIERASNGSWSIDNGNTCAVGLTFDEICEQAIAVIEVAAPGNEPEADCVTADHTDECRRARAMELAIGVAGLDVLQIGRIIAAARQIETFLKGA